MPGYVGNCGCFRPAARWLDAFGWTGVDLFFVLSGFLLGGILMKELQVTHHLDILRFYIRRAFKIWPAYYFFLAIWLIVFLQLAPFAKLGWPTLLAHCFFIQTWSYNWLNSPTIYNPLFSLGSFGHLWSLSVEEHFYAFLPLFLLVMNRLSLKHLPSAIGLICSVCLIVRSIILTMYFPHRADQQVFFWFFPLFRFDALLFGVFLAYMRYFQPEIFTKIGRRTAFLFALAFLFISPTMLPDNYKLLTYDPEQSSARFAFIGSLGLTMLYLGYGSTLVALLNLKEETKEALTRNPITKFLAWTGFYSYSIYLWHFFFLAQFQIFSLLVHDNISWIAVKVATVLTAVFVGYVAARLVEIRPCASETVSLPRN